MCPFSVAQIQPPSDSLPNETQPSKQAANLNAAQQDSSQESKLHNAAKDFEAILIDSLWSSMKKGSLGGDDQSQDDPIGDSFTDLGMQMASRAIADAGGLGIGKMIVKSLQAKIDR